MMLRSGRVVDIADDHLTVRFERASACGACRANKLCSGNAPTTDLVLHTLEAKTHRLGDEVQVGIPQELALRASAAAYLVPVAGLIGGMGLGTVLGLVEAAVVALSFAGLGIGLLATRRISRHPSLQGAPQLVDAAAIESACATPAFPVSHPHKEIS